MTEKYTTIEDTVLEVFSKTYSESHGNKLLISHTVATLSDPVMAKVKDEGDASPAAEWIRASLWGCFGGDYEAATSTTRDLFSTLGREKELGWMTEE